MNDGGVDKGRAILPNPMISTIPSTLNPQAIFRPKTYSTPSRRTQQQEPVILTIHDIVMQQEIALGVNNDNDVTPAFECDISGIMDVDENVQCADDVEMSDLNSTTGDGPKFSEDNEQLDDDDANFNDALDDRLRDVGPSDNEDEPDPDFIKELQQVKANMSNLRSSQMKKEFAHFSNDPSTKALRNAINTSNSSKNSSRSRLETSSSQRPSRLDRACKSVAQQRYNEESSSTLDESFNASSAKMSLVAASYGYLEQILTISQRSQLVLFLFMLHVVFGLCEVVDQIFQAHHHLTEIDGLEEVLMFSV